MTKQQKNIGAVVLCVIALAALAYATGLIGGRTVGADVEATATCPKCNNVQNLKMSSVFASGYMDTGKGWMIKCSKCGEPVRVIRNGIEARKGDPVQ